MLLKKGIWIGLVVLLLLAAGGYAYYRFVYLPGHTLVEEQQIKTGQVLQGDVIVAVSGSGTLSPATETELGFEAGGYLDEILVAVGDEVKAGDVLARLKTDDLELAVADAEIALRLQDMTMADQLEEASEAELASAEAAVTSARSALAVAQLEYDSSQNSDMDEAVRSYLIKYEYSVDQFYELDSNGADDDDLADAWNEWATSEYDLNDYLKLAQMEELDAANNVDQAANNLVQAQERLELLQAGVTTDTVLSAQLKLDRAQLVLDEANSDLAAAELQAPFDGTVVAVGAQDGEYVGTGSFITLADLEAPLLQFWVEESDMSGVAVGNKMEIVFEGLPDDVFAGVVTQVEIELVTVQQTLALQAWASIDTMGHSATLLSGMNADADVISAEVRDVLLVPLEALRTLGTGQYAVMVVHDDGEMELRMVEVGLKDFVYAEVISGLELGEVVSLGVEQAVTAVEAEMPALPGGAGGFLMGGGGPGGR